MKKLLVLGLFLGLVGSVSALEKLDVTTGVYMESENHNAKYNESDVTVHGAKVNLNFKDFPLWTEFVYEYRNANSLTGHSGDADRYMFKLGSKLTFGDFAFKPEYELRITDVRESDKKTTDHRFKPNWNYKFNDQFTLYNNWLFGYRVDKNTRGYAEAKDWDDYFHEIETGLKYSFTDDQSVEVGFFNEYMKAEKSDLQYRGEKFEDWQIRLAYTKQFSNGISVTPFTRISLESKTKNPNGTDTKYNGKGRYGVKLGYTADNGIGISAETYYQNEPRKTEGVKASDKNRTFFKLGLDYTF